MFFRILKKDLKRKRTMNFILFVFITIASLFLASSVANLLVISNAVDYFVDKAKTPDYLVFTIQSEEKPDVLLDWIKESDFVKDYSVDETMMFTKENFSIVEGDTSRAYEPTSMILLERQPKKYMQLLDEKGNLIELKQGEIAIPFLEKENNDLELGDQIVVEVGSVKKEFKITCFLKDAICGSSMMGIKRMQISDEDYASLSSSENVIKNNFYSIATDQVADFAKAFKGENFSTQFTFEKENVKLCYIMDMMIAGILIIVGICLILIAFLILRFTIVFTLQDDYKEIGIMKAIGLKNRGIKSLYLVKYFSLAVVGAAIGCIFSFPFSNMLLSQVGNDLLMEDVVANAKVNVGCSLLVVVMVVIFCYTSTNKLKKFSAIDAIRNGSNGERYSKKSLFKLNKTKSMGTPVYMALNDIMSSPKRFVVLVLTFVIGTMLIIMPLNAMNTLKDGDIVKLFGMTRSDLYIDSGNIQDLIELADKNSTSQIMKDMEEDFATHGIEMDIYEEVGFRFNYYGDDEKDAYVLYTMQSLEYDDSGYDFLEGSIPTLENEIALTEISANAMGVGIGDTVHAIIDQQEQSFVVTGLFQSMNMMGESARLNNKIAIDYKNLSGLNSFQGNIKGNAKEKASTIEKLKGLYPDYEFQSAQEYTSGSLGGIVDQIDGLKNLIVAIVLCINALITVLMVKTFVAKEKGEIAMLKSIGFRNSAIRLWQVLRISMVLMLAIIIGILLSQVLDPLTSGKIFATMGANHVKIKVIAKEVYLFYPMLLLGVTTFVACISTRAIKRIHLNEMSEE